MTSEKGSCFPRSWGLVIFHSPSRLKAGEMDACPGPTTEMLKTKLHEKKLARSCISAVAHTDPCSLQVTLSDPYGAKV